MALYDGFFDFDQAVLENTGKYDREYNAGAFTDLLDAALGSGVYVGESPDSMKVALQDGRALVAPGYLFLKGYWLANRVGDDEDPAAYPGYFVGLPTTGTVAVVARLNLGSRIIELTTTPQAETYPDCLVLALIDTSTGTVTDTRTDASLCGLIDSAGSTAAKAAYAVNYIDNEIEGRLEQAEADIAAKSAEMDAKISEVGSQLSKLAPPPVGTVKFTASQNVDADWLPCDGSFINEADYPDLVAALGKLTPSADKFQLLSAGEVPQQISNGVLYAGRMWVYSYSSAKLYGIDVEGNEPVKEVTLTSTDSHFTDFVPPTVTRPICLSITPHIGKAGAKVFLTQIIQDGSNNNMTNYAWMQYCLIFGAEFAGEEESLAMEPPFASISRLNSEDTDRGYPMWNAGYAIPYVVSFSENGSESFFMYIGKSYGLYSNPSSSIKWDENTGANATVIPANFGGYDSSGLYNKYQRFGYSPKSFKEGVSASVRISSGTRYAQIQSGPHGQFDYSWTDYGGNAMDGLPFRESYVPINIIGEDFLVAAYDKNSFPAYSRKSPELNVRTPNLNLPTAARVFVDGAAYLWGKSIYMFFVGTGLIFSRTLEDGSFGYLDTTNVLGTITQFGYLDYSQDEGTLYLLGQDSQNQVKLAKIVLNTLYDYANDGAWLPQIASDGVPAYIKAIHTEPPSGDREVTIKVTVGGTSVDKDRFNRFFAVQFNGERLAVGKTYTRVIPEGTATFTVGLEKTNDTSSTTNITGDLSVDDSQVIFMNHEVTAGEIKTVTLRWEDYEDTITIQGSSQ